MAKLTRKNQKVFGTSATGTASSAIGKVGSLAAGLAVQYSGAAADPDNIQALSNFLDGWSSCIVGSNSPALQDMNGLFWLLTRQLAYLYQTGVAEWNTSTVYYIGSLVNDGSGNLYESVTDTNSGNALSDTANWANLSRTSVVTKSADYTLVKGDAIVKVSVNTVLTLLGATTCTGLVYKVWKTDSNATTVTFNTTSAQTMSGIASGSLTITEQWSWAEFTSDGSNWLVRLG